jgi:hypothetical protein
VIVHVNLNCSIAGLLTGRHVNFYPSPPWGRGWLANGAFISRGETGEGVKIVAPDMNLTLGVRLGTTPSPTALRSPLSPKGAREEEFFN